MGFYSFALCLNEENYKPSLIYNTGPLQLSACSVFITASNSDELKEINGILKPVDIFKRKFYLW